MVRIGYYVPGDEIPLNLDGDAPTGGFFRDPVLWQFRTKTYPVLWHFWTETYPVLWHFWPKTYPVLWTNFHKVALFMKNSVKVVFLDDTPFSTQFFGEIKYDVLFYED